MPAQGWNVMQSGTLDHERTARAIAADVPLDPRDDLGGEPRWTLRSLPPRGIVISVIFRPRGDAEIDAAYAVRESPLRVTDAHALAPLNGPQRSVWGLRAALGGFNVEARMYFGASTPSAKTLGRAQRQLNRLVVAASPVTMFARPTIIPAINPWTTLYGSVESGKAGEGITIQAKDCGSSFFRVASGATTEEGGGWSIRYSPGINTVLRAVWDGKASNQVSVRQRPFVRLEQRGRNEFRVGAGSSPRGGMPGGAQASFWRKRMLFQRFERRLGSWVTVKQVVLTDSGAGTSFRAALPVGTLVRALLPLSQTRPCFLSGVSFTLRVARR
jgi:hypothetical protein